MSNEPTGRERLRARLVLPEWLEAGLVGAFAVVAVLFARDAWLGVPLHTPSVLGVWLLEGVAAAGRTTSAPGAAALYHCVHFAGWIALGLVATRLVRKAEDDARLRWLPPAALVLALAALAAVEAVLPATPVARPMVSLGGVAGLAAMGAFLVWRHPGALPG